MQVSGARLWRARRRNARRAGVRSVPDCATFGWELDSGNGSYFLLRGNGHSWWTIFEHTFRSKNIGQLGQLQALAITHKSCAWDYRTVIPASLRPTLVHAGRPQSLTERCPAIAPAGFLWVLKAQLMRGGRKRPLKSSGRPFGFSDESPPGTSETDRNLRGDLRHSKPHEGS